MIQETVNSEIGKVNLPVLPNQPLGTKQSCHAVTLIPMPLQQTDDNINIQFSASFHEPIGTRSRDRFDNGKGLVQAGETVSRQGAFWKDDEPGPFLGSKLG